MPVQPTRPSGSTPAPSESPQTAPVATGPATSPDSWHVAPAMVDLSGPGRMHEKALGQLRLDAVHRPRPSNSIEAFFRAVVDTFLELGNIFGVDPITHTYNTDKLASRAGEQLAKDNPDLLRIARSWSRQADVYSWEFRSLLADKIASAMADKLRAEGQEVEPYDLRAEAREIALNAMTSVPEDHGGLPKAYLAELANERGGVWPAVVADAPEDGEAYSGYANAAAFMMLAEKRDLLRVPHDMATEVFEGLANQLMSPGDIIRSLAGLAALPAPARAELDGKLEQLPASVRRPWLAQNMASIFASGQASTAILPALDRAVTHAERLTPAQVRQAFEEGYLGYDPNTPLLAKLKRHATGRPIARGAQTNSILFLGMGDHTRHEANRLRQQAPEGVDFVGHLNEHGGKVTVPLRRADGSRTETTFDLSQPADLSKFVSVLGLTGGRARTLHEMLSHTPTNARDELGDLAVAFAEAEAGARTIERLVLSGHSTGSSLWGDTNGTLQFGVLSQLRTVFPKGTAGIEDIFFSACYTAGDYKLDRFRKLFPNVKTIWAYHDSSPGSWTGAIEHEAIWEPHTRGPHRPGAILEGLREVQSERKGDNVEVWDNGAVGGGYRGTYDEALANYRDNAGVYDDFFAGTQLVTDTQRGPLRDYYRHAQQLSGHLNTPDDVRTEALGRVATTIRLIFFARLAKRYNTEHRQSLENLFSAAGLPKDTDIGAMNRKQFMDFMTDLEQRLNQTTDGTGQSPIGLPGVASAFNDLRSGLVDFSPEIIPDNWI